MSVTLSPQTGEIMCRFVEEIKAYPTAAIEDVLRKRIARDMRELRRDYPELFPKKRRQKPVA